MEALCEKLGHECEFPLNKKGKRSRQSPWDIKINGMTFELKTATEDVSGAFQFNHIRYHREYEALICVGIAPDRIFVGGWSKADVATGKAGTLVSMEKSGSASHKLTKRPEQLNPVREFNELIQKLTIGFS